MIKEYKSIDVAKVLGVTRKAVYYHLVSGKMRARKLGGRFIVSDVELKRWKKLPQKLTNKQKSCCKTGFFSYKRIIFLREI